MTLIETLIVAAVLGIVLGAAALATSSIRTEMKRRQVSELLATLDEALSAYQKVTRVWPDFAPMAATRPAEHGAAVTRHDEAGEGSADPVIAALAAVPQSRQILDAIPAVLRVHRDADGHDLPGWGTVQDAWGRRLRCLTISSPAAVDRQAVAANGGRPIFVSASRNGRFHAAGASEAADDLRSDELPR